MARAILAVIVGYVAMFVIVFVCLTGAYLALGANRAFVPGGWEPSVVWLATMFLVGLVAAVVGGLVCAKIAKGGRAPKVLAGLVLVLGLLMAIPAFMAPEEGQTQPRPDDVSNMEAMQTARPPAWVGIVNPIIGAVGVLAGAGLRSKES